jgi:hypothetical protein
MPDQIIRFPVDECGGGAVDPEYVEIRVIVGEHLDRRVQNKGFFPF